MRITYDAEVDALYIRFIETTETKHVAEGVALDYDAEGRIAGIEILDAVKRFGTKDVFKKVTLEDLALHKRRGAIHSPNPYGAWWRCRDLNPGHCGYEPHALTD